ncbi:hypothetical protein AiwAL_05300 [Acidiphilium sp. AL]|uniref:DUF4105 domain-containing protein n=1 Tax=Acidiphilium iwatense TaxID=768198 RepID=A0ABS9DSJ8_9PROT|nr:MULTISPECIES: hypothetical protein [Acidiphilium]MCF3945677.1 hypothetical protein [Acidiphilium iwatense]MCU4159520.1 hypothetical protein [Acidiphilium sp. AL]
MTVTVYVWRFRKLGVLGFGNVGHASIQVRFSGAADRDFYLSWWPGGDDVHGRARQALRHTTSHSLQVGYGNKAQKAARDAVAHATDERGNLLVPDDKLKEVQSRFVSDKTAEGRSAEAKYKFNLNGTKLLNETRMEAAFQSIHQGRQTLSAKGHAKAGEYSLVHQNCSDAVAWLLEAGGAGTLVPKPKMRFFWTPTDIAKWCDRLVLAANDKKSGAAQRIRGFTNNDIDFTPLDWKFSALATAS